MSGPACFPNEIKGFSGAEGQNRTGDTCIFSAVLYRLSYLGARRNYSERVPHAQTAADQSASIEAGSLAGGRSADAPTE